MCGLCAAITLTDARTRQHTERVHATWLGARIRAIEQLSFRATWVISCMRHYIYSIMLLRAYDKILLNNIWDSFRQNGPSYIYIKCYKNASLLNCYIFRTVNAINFQFSTLHTTPFPYGKIYFGVLHLLRASIATFDTPSGSNSP